MNKNFNQIRNFILSLLVLVGICNYSYGQNNSSIDFKVSYLIDSTNQFTIDKLSPHVNFIASPLKTFDFGFTDAAIWMSIDIQKSENDLLLTVENCHIDSIEVYLFSNNKLIRKNLSGDHLPFSTRYLQSNFFNFLVPKGTDKIFLKTKTQGMTALPIQILSFESFYNYYQSYTKFHWTYFGLVILTIISNLLFYFWLKETIYLNYVFCVLGIGIVTAVDFEYTFQFLWPNHPVFNLYNVGYYSFFMFTILFTDKLLMVRKNLPKVYPIFIFFYSLAAFIVLLAIFNQYNTAVKVLIYTSPLVPIFCLLSGFLIFLKHRDQVVKFYLVGWVGYFVFMFLYIITMLGYLPLNIYSSNLLPMGSSLEIIFLNLAILSKINTLKQEKEDLLFEQNRVLEEKVHIRTIELHEKADEILAQNEEMLNQQTELEAQRDTLEVQNKIIEEQNLLLKGSKESLEKLVERRTDELKITNEELVDYNHRLEQFAFVTAHNLRGPVATLLGLAQIYNRNDISDPVNLTILDRSNETTLKLDGIIKDLVGILDLQKNSSALGENIFLLNVLNDVKILLSKEIEESHIRIDHNLTSTTTLFCVSAFINNIFYNLVSNAIKYRKADSPSSLTIEYKIEGDNIKIDFTDNGRGIDLDKFREKLFYPYKRFHLDKEGKGLGLYIVKTQIEIMKGSISVLSAPNAGSCFTIILPNKKN